jgi:hypothetical protein
MAVMYIKVVELQSRHEIELRRMVSTVPADLKTHWENA